MKILVTLLFMTLIGFGTLEAAALEKVVNSPSLTLKLVFEKPLAVGLNSMKVLLSNKKFEEAEVSVKVFMPAMPGMPAMQDISKAKNLSNGVYRAQVNFSMRGTWQVHIFITPKEGRKIRVKSSLNL